MSKDKVRRCYYYEYDHTRPNGMVENHGHNPCGGCVERNGIYYCEAMYYVCKEYTKAPEPERTTLFDLM